MSDSEVLIRAEHVSKKFCRSLKRSLWYGAQDMATSLVLWKRDPGNDAVGGEVIFREPSLREDEFWAVRDVSFEVRRGECLGLIGHNGAGKSTLLKMLNSLNRPDSGRITMKGKVGALIELSAGFNSILTGRENIYSQAALLGFAKKETDRKFDAIVEFSELEEFLDMPVQNYSSGMRVRLGFSIAAQMEPDILLLDEVLAVGDVEFRFKCLNRMSELLSRSAVIFVSHSMPQLHRVCTSIMTLSHGRPLFYGVKVSDGIDAYYASMDMNIREEMGNSAFALTDFQLRSSENHLSELGKLVVNHGDGLEMQLNLKHPQNIEPLAIQVVFWSQELLPVMEIVGKEKTPHRFVPNESGETSLRLSIPALHLNAGRYTIEIVVHTSNMSRREARFLPPIELQLRSFTVSGANTVLEGNWTSATKKLRSSSSETIV